MGWCTLTKVGQPAASADSCGLMVEERLCAPCPGAGNRVSGLSALVSKPENVIYWFFTCSHAV